MKLYELGDAYRLINKRIEETEGSDTAEDVVLRAALDAIEDGIEQKAQSIAIMEKEWLAEAASIGEEAERLKKRKAALVNRAEAIRAYLLSQLVKAGISKLKTKLFNFVVNPARKSVVIGDADMIPDPYILRTERVPDKNAIKAAIEAGNLVPGAHVEEGAPSLTVR